MIIENVAASFPARTVCNEEMVDLIRAHSKNYEGDLHSTLRVVKARLERSGISTRRWLSDGERPIDHVAHVVDSTLKGSALQPSEVELVIYVGICGSFRKLGNAYMVAKLLGMHRAECFDVLDACMSWTRAISLANSLFKTRSIRNALIVNAEFNVIDGIVRHPDNCIVRNPKELEYLLPSFTVGEAACATLLLPTDPENFSITMHSKPECADLCVITSPGHEGFFDISSTVAQMETGRFTALGRQIHEQIAEGVVVTMAKSQSDPGTADIVFTHASSWAAWDRLGKQHGFADKIFHIYPETGNVGSASIPAAMAMAQAAGRLSKGHRVSFLMGSAGMSFAASRFTF